MTNPHPPLADMPDFMQRALSKATTYPQAEAVFDKWATVFFVEHVVRPVVWLTISGEVQ